MEYVTLAGPEFRPVAEKLVDMDQPLPNILLPHIGFAAMDGERVAGMAVLQCVPFIEPFRVDSEYRQSNVGLRLLDMATEYIKQHGVPRVFCHTAHPVMEQLLLRRGAVKSSEPFFEYRKDW
jgi:hypothetical protein